MTDYETLREHLAHIHLSSDDLLYAQFQDWITALYEDCKDRVIRCSREEREELVGMAIAYRRMIEDLQNPVQT